MGREIEIILIRPILLFTLDDTRGPGVAVSPFHLVALHVEHRALVGPVEEVGGGEHAEGPATPARIAVGGTVDIVFLCLVGIEHLRVSMEVGQDGVVVVGKSLQQPVFLSLCDGDDGAMTWGELTFGSGVLHHLESLQVIALAELIMASAIAVVHHYPRLAVDGLADTHTFHSFFCLIYVTLDLGPLTARTLSRLCGECLRSSLVDTTAALAFIEEVIASVSIVEDDVAVDGCRAAVEEELRFTDEVGEVVVDIGVIDAVERLGVACAQ